MQPQTCHIKGIGTRKIYITRCEYEGKDLVAEGYYLRRPRFIDEYGMQKVSVLNINDDNSWFLKEK